ncbi:tail tube protein [Pseudomonas phage DDSR119]|nr:tail tube protein [Pseudomonas phage DDSR119]
MAIPATGCKLDKYVGRDVAFEFALACGDVEDPKVLTYLPIGALRAKEFSLEWDTVDATADNNKSNDRAMLATYKTFSCSGDGTCMRKDGTQSNQTMLYKHVMNPVGGQPVAWIRITCPDITVWAFCIITSMGRTMPYDELSTFNFEATATESSHGVLVEDTPEVPAGP